jgi:hypothetical protein
MKTALSHPKKSPPTKARKVGRVTPCAPVFADGHPANRRVRVRRDGGQRTARPTIHLPTQLERDTLLTPEWVAESVVQEVERFLNARLPDDFSERLAAKAHYLYPRHQHFHKGLNRPGWRGRENLLMFMRHWTAGWLKRERNPLHKKLPYSFGMGRRLPVVPPMFLKSGE